MRKLEDECMGLFMSLSAEKVNKPGVYILELDLCLGLLFNVENAPQSRSLPA